MDGNHSGNRITQEESFVNLTNQTSQSETLKENSSDKQTEMATCVETPKSDAEIQSQVAATVIDQNNTLKQKQLSCLNANLLLTESQEICIDGLLPIRDVKITSWKRDSNVVIDPCLLSQTTTQSIQSTSSEVSSNTAIASTKNNMNLSQDKIHYHGSDGEKKIIIKFKDNVHQGLFYFLLFFFTFFFTNSFLLIYFYFYFYFYFFLKR